MPTAKEEPCLSHHSSPIPMLIASVFQEPDEWSDASTWANHDNREGGVFGKTELVDSTGDKGNLRKN